MTWREPAPLRRRTDCAIPKNNCAVLACIANKALLGARSYLVPDPIRTIMMCGRGGTGRRATLRSLWPKGRGSSSLLDRTIQSCGTSKIGSNSGPPRKGAPSCAVRAFPVSNCGQRSE